MKKILKMLKKYGCTGPGAAAQTEKMAKLGDKGLALCQKVIDACKDDRDQLPTVQR